MAQEQYNQWVLNTSTTKQDGLCGNNYVSPNELYFIKNYAKKNIIDIGCGTGHRTFPIWFERKLNFYGIEKFQNLINNSNYRDYIVQSDISSMDFMQRVNELPTKQWDIAFLFGGVINGIIDSNLQINTWKNFKSLLDKCNYILIDTLTQFQWYSTAEKGEEIQLYPSTPIQYFYSMNEFDNLNNNFGLEFCEERTEHFMGTGPIRTHYLIRKQTNLCQQPVCRNGG